MPQVQSDRILKLLESSKEVESAIRINGEVVARRLDELLATQIDALGLTRRRRATTTSSAFSPAISAPRARRWRRPSGATSTPPPRRWACACAAAS